MIPVNANENNFKDFLFYDIEVFKENSLVVFKDIDHQTVAIFDNLTGFNGIGELIEGKILVGYNNYAYDDYVLSEMLSPSPAQDLIKRINDNIIKGFNPGITLDRRIESLDCFQQINVAKSSLKRIEANLGLSIDETEVDFDLDRALTKEELERTIRYCCHDVDATIEVFKLRWYTYFIPKLSVVNMLDKEIQDIAIRWNTTTITAQLLKGNTRARRWSGYRLLGNDNESYMNRVPAEVVEMWKEAEVSIAQSTGKMNVKGKVTVEDMGCIFEFGFGGLHGVAKTGNAFEDVKLLDVTSMYPNILINITGLDEATATYSGIVDRRMKIKHVDKNQSDALKLVINATYGLLKNQYSKLYNPIAGTSVAIVGQVALYDLCSRLYDAGYRLINVNTDGVAFNGNLPESTWKRIKEEWETDYNMGLEMSTFRRWIQKDVNNYIAVTDSGHVKVKGGDVNKYHDPDAFEGDLLHLPAGVTWTGNNSMGIVARCVVEYVLKGTEPYRTILDNLDKPLLFQMVLQAGSTYEGTFDQEGREYQKVNRIFAGKEDGVTLVKRKPDGSVNRYPDAPEKMYVYNGDLKEFDDFSSVIDIQYYVDMAESVCQRWTV